MGENTAVEYVRHSFSPWWGCSHVSPGCKNCFAETWAKRWGDPGLWHRHGPRRIVSRQQWSKPRRWNREAEQEGMRARVLCGTMCDVFEDHPDVGDARARLFRLIEETPWLLWLLFTKRPENVNGMIPWGSSWPDNAGLVASVENDEYTKRIPLVLDTAAPLKGLSVEPLIGPVNLEMRDWAPPGNQGFRGAHSPLAGQCRPAEGDPGEEYETLGTGLPRLDWIILGGESGASTRPLHPEWARDVYRQCQSAGVPMWFKQWGEVGPAPWTVPQRPGESLTDYKVRAAAECATLVYSSAAHLDHNKLIPVTEPAWSRNPDGLDPSLAPMRRWGKEAAGHLLDGREVQELPAAAFLTPDGRAA